MTKSASCGVVPHAPESKLTPPDRSLQQALLQRVSRTFALTIPELPTGLDDVVANAYLLCRIADTIEDNNTLPANKKRAYFDQLNAVLAGTGSAANFSVELLRVLNTRTPPGERELIDKLSDVIAIFRQFNSVERSAMCRCVRIMCEGMDEFGGGRREQVNDIASLERYCYFVAGVVGEMLTDLFCAYSPKIADASTDLSRLGIRFGIGLQLTNILKDFWEDYHRGACWLPKAMLSPVTTVEKSADYDSEGRNAKPTLSNESLTRLIALARGHLRAALDYVLLIPASELQVRRFCLRALGLALLTLQSIHRHRAYQSSQEVKIRRRTLRTVLFVTDISASHDRLLQSLFGLGSIGLPKPLS